VKSWNSLKFCSWRWHCWPV